MNWIRTILPASIRVAFRKLPSKILEFFRKINPRCLLVWLAYAALASLPIWPILGAANNDFGSDLHLVEKAVIAVAGLIALLNSTPKDLFEVESNRQLRQCYRCLYCALALLLYAGALKLFILGHSSGEFTTEFSSDFNFSPSKFTEATTKPWGWLVPILFCSLTAAYFLAFFGMTCYLRLFFPSIKWLSLWKHPTEGR